MGFLELRIRRTMLGLHCSRKAQRQNQFSTSTGRTNHDKQRRKKAKMKQGKGVRTMFSKWAEGQTVGEVRFWLALHAAC